jgi:hypothetical protein
MRKHIFAATALATSLSVLAPISVWAQGTGGGAIASAANISNLKQGLKVGGRYYVNADKLNLRSQDSTSGSLVGSLSRNDQVEILDLLSSATVMVKIKIVSSRSASNSLAPALYVSAEYLSANARASEPASGQSKYILIQNIATEKMRIYERCTTSPDCPHRLVMETDMVAGRPEGESANKKAFYTWLGRFKITRWVKFYEDGNGSYPSWYDPNYPTLPRPGASMSSWISKKLLPSGKNGPRGAFGWYTALTGPNSNNEWVHGTLGWGADGDKFIRETRKVWLNIFSDPRSHGCTRVENRAIAYARHILPVGTEIYRVYAKEAYRDPALGLYANQKSFKPWEFTLTKEGVRTDGPDPDKNVTAARGIPESLVLERGSYMIDQYPTAVPLKKGAGWISRVKGKSGNTYDIDDNGFHGVFLVDEGRFVDYHHPSTLPVGGYPDRELPSYMKAYGSYSLP